MKLSRKDRKHLGKELGRERARYVAMELLRDELMYGGLKVHPLYHFYEEQQKEASTSGNELESELKEKKSYDTIVRREAVKEMERYKAHELREMVHYTHEFTRYMDKEEFKERGK